MERNFIHAAPLKQCRQSVDRFRSKFEKLGEDLLFVEGTLSNKGLASGKSGEKGLILS